MKPDDTERSKIMNKLIEITDLTVGYENKPKVLENVSLSVYENDFLGIIGPNGGGKTTLLRVVLGLLKPQSGVVTFYENGKRVDAINIGYLPQITRVDKKFPISVEEVLLSGFLPHRRLGTRYTLSERKRVREVALRLGIEDLLCRAVGELSGGEMQRVLLGRAVIDNPKVVILDEPNTYVDKLFENNFYKLLSEINKEVAIVLVSHDVGTILSSVKNVACVNRDLHYHSGNNLSAEWLSAAYASCPIELLGHGTLPHRVLMRHDHSENSGR